MIKKNLTTWYLSAFFFLKIAGSFFLFMFQIKKNNQRYGISVLLIELLL